MVKTAPKIKERPIVYGPEMIRALVEGRKTQTRRVFARQPTFNDTLGLYLMSRERGNGSHTNRRHVVVRNTKTRKVLEDRKYNLDLPEWLAEMCPLGKVGDRLWVRETWRTHERAEDGVGGFLFEADGGFLPIENTLEAAEKWLDRHTVRARPKDLQPLAPNGKLVAWARKPHGDRWRPSIHMPREACRIVLTITEVRAERLQDITAADALAEGVYKLADGYGWAWRGHENHTSPIVAFADLWNKFNPEHLGWEANPWTAVVTFQAEVARG